MMAEWRTRSNARAREGHDRRLAVNLTTGLFDHLLERLKRLW